MYNGVVLHGRRDKISILRICALIILAKRESDGAMHAPEETKQLFGVIRQYYLY